VITKAKRLKRDSTGVKMVFITVEKQPGDFSDLVLASDEPEWIVEQAKARKRREMLRSREEMEARLAKIRAKEKAQRERYLKGDQNYKKRKTVTEKRDGADDDEEQFVLDDYDSEAEQSLSRKGGTAGSGLSAATLELMAKLGMSMNGPKEEEVEAEDEMKVSKHYSIDLQQPNAYRYSTVRGHIPN
jgi:hypothetical protein